ncbi:MAG: DMT family transporter [Holophaga sp.]|jgi:drug/metabolite transporter (DMT)-like permease
MHHKRVAPLYGLIAGSLWGLSFLSIKVTVAVLPPMTLAAARSLVASAALPLIAWCAGTRLRVAARDLPILVLGGLLNITFYFYLTNHGLALLSASECALIIGLVPVATVLAERVFLGIRPGARAYAGALLSFLGVSLIVARQLSLSGSALGYALMAGAAMVFVAYIFATRAVSGRCGLLQTTFWQTLFGMLGCLPLALLEARAWRTPSAAVTLNVIFLGLFCSAVASWLYVTTISLLGGARASVFVNLMPVVAVAAAYFILGERLGGLQLAGGVVVVGGVYLATVPGRQVQAPFPSPAPSLGDPGE